MKPLKDTFKCPKCGGTEFVAVITGFDRVVPCSILPSGKKMVCWYDKETMSEGNDGEDYSVSLTCLNPPCSYELGEEDLGEYPGAVEQVAPEDADDEIEEEDYVKAQ